MPFHPFFGEGSPPKIDYRKTKKSSLILNSLLEDLGTKPGRASTAHAEAKAGFSAREEGMSLCEQFTLAWPLPQCTPRSAAKLAVRLTQTM